MRNTEVPVVSTCQTHVEWLQEQLEARKQDVADLQDSLHEAHSKYLYLGPTYDRVNDTPAKLSYYTGLPNSDVFDALWSLLSVTDDGIVSVGGKTAENRKRSRGGGRKSGLPLKDQLFFVLVRLRLGLDEEMIADLVGLTQPTISRMTAKWISFLYLKLGSLPLWLTSKQVKASLPECFRTKYDKTFCDH